MKIKTRTNEVVRSSFGNLIHALYESLPRKIRNTPKGAALVCIALVDLRARRVLLHSRLRPAV